MTTETAFSPANGKNQLVYASTTSQSVAVDSNAKSVRLVNDGSYTAYFNIGIGQRTASIVDMPLIADDTIVVYKGDRADTVSVICMDGSCLVHIQTGEGGF